METAHLVEYRICAIEGPRNRLVSTILEITRREIGLFIEELPNEAPINDACDAARRAVVSVFDDYPVDHNERIRNLRDALMANIDALSMATADQI